MQEASLIQLLQQRLRFSKRIQRADAAVLIAIIVAVITWCILLWSHFG